MTAPYPYTVTRESATVVVDGKPIVVKRGATNFNALRKALLDEDWSAVKDHLRSGTSLVRWARGKFSVEPDGRTISYEGKPVPADLNKRILEMSAADEDPERLFKFWERLKRNPSMRSVEQLFPFLQHQGIPLTEDGCFLAYKGVKEDLTDCHTGTISNRPGQTVSVPRNEVSDDPDHACHFGLHVGAYEYARGFGPRLVVCKVDPEHVVCVPHDSSQQKMRVCRYTVVGFHGEGLMPSTSIPKKDVPNPKQRRPEKHAKLDAMSQEELMQLPLDRLRSYASKGLHIVGAWRFPGGKISLVRKILEVRGKR